MKGGERKIERASKSSYMYRHLEILSTSGESICDRLSLVYPTSLFCLSKHTLRMFHSHSTQPNKALALSYFPSSSSRQCMDLWYLTNNNLYVELMGNYLFNFEDGINWRLFFYAGIFFDIVHSDGRELNITSCLCLWIGLWILIFIFN